MYAFLSPEKGFTPYQTGMHIHMSPNPISNKRIRSERHLCY